MCSHLKNRLFCAVVVLFALAVIFVSRSSAQEAEFRYEKDIAAYEEKSRTNPLPDDCTMFIGSSTWRLWGDLLEKDFAEFHAINRGFGGSTVPDQLRVMDRLVLPYKPARIAFFCGGNDIARGATAEETFSNFKTFLSRLWAESPETEVFFVSVTGAPSRESSREQTLKYNQLVKELVDQTTGLYYVNTFATLTGEDGKAQEKYFLKDRLHLNRDGQEQWIPVIKKALQEAKDSKKDVSPEALYKERVRLGLLEDTPENREK